MLHGKSNISLIDFKHTISNHVRTQTLEKKFQLMDWGIL